MSLLDEVGERVLVLLALIQHRYEAERRQYEHDQRAHGRNGEREADEPSPAVLLLRLRRLFFGVIRVGVGVIVIPTGIVRGRQQIVAVLPIAGWLVFRPIP